MYWSPSDPVAVECPEETGHEVYSNSFWDLEKGLLFCTSQRTLTFDTDLE